MPFSPESVAARDAHRGPRPRRTGPPPTPAAFRKRSRPGPAPGSGGPRDGDGNTRDLVFVAAANAFSRDGLDGVGVDDIAKAAGVNKAMIYYHFKDKLTLYREVVRDMLRALGAAVADLGAIEDTPERKIERFIETIGELRDARPWFPPLMMREMSAGAPHLDDTTLGHMRNVFMGFSAILEEGVQSGAFRRVHPLMAYMSIMGPLMMNAMRERAAVAPGRKGHAMFMTVDRQDLITHIQENALRMLAPEAVRKEQSR